MAMSNAERQRKYREKHRNSENSRINTIIDTSAHSCLKRIARYKGISERDALQEILKEAVDRVIAEDEKLQNSRTKAYKEFYATVWD